MDLITELEQNGLHISKRSGGIYRWQDEAVRMWQGLKLEGKPSPGWFRLFKYAFAKNRIGLLNSTFSTVADSNAYKPELYFYKVYNNKLHEHTI